MPKEFVVALDQGTTSSRAVLFDRRGEVRGLAQQAFKQIYPQPGWVEHDPREVLSSQFGALTKLLVSHDIHPDQIDSIGVTNQRETTVIWDRQTGAPVYNAIVWQCRRTAGIIEEVCGDPDIARRITETTGLVPDAYFSASKIKWILDTVPGARAAAQQGRLCFGTIDSWLIWSFTQGKVHATDVTNASRTMLFDIHQGAWSPWLCELFDIPPSLLPEVRPSAGFFGTTAHPGTASGIPICGVAGDQQAALFGQCCFEAGQAKNTYGTGCFLLMHTGQTACASGHRLVTTIAASAPGQARLEYALEGSVFVAGALIQWLRDELGLIESVEEAEALASSVPDTAGVYVVPAFTGLGAPYWDAEARGAIYGLTRGTGRAHLARAALESLAYQVSDLLEAMEADAGTKVGILHVDGGASNNDFLMQFQSDILGCRLARPQSIESTAAGAAYLSGLSTGFWKDVDELRALGAPARLFEPNMTEEMRRARLMGWSEALYRTRGSTRAEGPEQP
ncbi:MAG: glycerol kinase GlpK [Coriobacteriaceae bacterium]|jgi:glycerol kinase|nr:glycerol kinase GlpK [Coriobacteriaceae bacterium]